MRNGRASALRLATRTHPSCTSKKWNHADHEGVGVFGNLMMIVFIVLAVGMAAVAIHQEERLAPQERQLLQQR